MVRLSGPACVIQVLHSIISAGSAHTCAAGNPSGAGQADNMSMQAAQGGASRVRPYDVFLSHAGEQKKEFVDTVCTLLTEVHSIRTFVDEHELQPGDAAWPAMEAALREAAVGT